MKIIILGAGKVGASAAESLSREEHDITLVDRDPGALNALQDRLDIRVVEGHASSPEVLRRAGAEDVDLMLAVTDSDEVNMIACQVAHALFNTPTKIARVRSADYLAHQGLFCREEIPIDVIISPEQVVTEQIHRLIEHPGALQVIDFAGGKIRLVGLRAYHGGALVGHELRELEDHLPTVNTRVAAIYRRDSGIIPTGKTVIEPDDEVFFIAAADDIRRVMQELRSIEEAGRRVIIAGAGNIGFRLAQKLERGGFNVKLIERDAERARDVSERLGETTVGLRGNAADEELLRQEKIDQMELFCALTEEDETNILSAMLAKQLGARRTMAIVNRSAYIDLIESNVLDIAISPRLATVSALLSHVRRGDVQAAHSLRRGAAEVIEAVAHGDQATSKLVGRSLRDIKFPSGASIGAIMRDDKVVRLSGDSVIEEGDHLIIFVIDKRRIADVEKLFQVSASFF
ncbi:MAG: Trk system potassium transporter TrkA [Gammaproteobacteria bacterium]|nr:Trk system potassium transporter TrkA [Gammaproteobacteria bacterium]